MTSAVHEYPHAMMERTLASSGAELPPQWALQDPADYVAGLQRAVPAAVGAAGIRPEEVVAIATDLTAGTPLLDDRDQNI
jgi:L-ribulokinase